MVQEVIIRKYSKKDKAGVLEVCYKTGYMGEDLSGRNIFNDRFLFGKMFCWYYIQYEPEKCFVAEDSHGRIAGYIIGTDNTKKQLRQFAWKVIPGICLRLLFYTAWVHPESFRQVIGFIKGTDTLMRSEGLNEQYPAHLHINLLPGYQHLGIGSRLLEAFEKEMRILNAKGIHLRTSNKNEKAVYFYIKNGYRIQLEHESRLWKNVNDYRSIVFTKELKDDLNA